MGSRCQSTIMALAGASAAPLDVEDGVVAGLGEQDPGNLLGIDFNGNGIVACSIEDGRNFSGDADAARGILVELARSGLGYDDFRHSSLFSSSGTGPLAAASSSFQLVASGQLLSSQREEQSAPSCLAIASARIDR